MVDANVVAMKLAELSDRITRVREHCPAEPQGLENDRDVLDLVSFNLFLAVQACLDVASHLISDQKWPTQIHEAAMTGLPDLESFATEVGAWVKERVAQGS